MFYPKFEINTTNDFDNCIIMQTSQDVFTGEDEYGHYKSYVNSAFLLITNKGEYFSFDYDSESGDKFELNDHDKFYNWLFNGNLVKNLYCDAHSIYLNVENPLFNGLYAINYSFDDHISKWEYKKPYFVDNSNDIEIVPSQFNLVNHSRICTLPQVIGVMEAAPTFPTYTTGTSEITTTQGTSTSNSNATTIGGGAYFKTKSGKMTACGSGGYVEFYLETMFSASEKQSHKEGTEEGLKYASTDKDDHSVIIKYSPVDYYFYKNNVTGDDYVVQDVHIPVTTIWDLKYYNEVRNKNINLSKNGNFKGNIDLYSILPDIKELNSTPGKPNTYGNYNRNTLEVPNSPSDKVGTNIKYTTENTNETSDTYKVSGSIGGGGIIGFDLFACKAEVNVGGGVKAEFSKSTTTTTSSTSSISYSGTIGRIKGNNEDYGDFYWGLKQPSRQL